MTAPILLTRLGFTQSVHNRDGHACVVCGRSPIYSDPVKCSEVDAHHIIDRALFEDGGYYLDNGVTVCSNRMDGTVSCHVLAEQTVISTSQLRDAAGIKNVILPDHLDADTTNDKWGNPILPNGNRMIGEMFFRENVQKALDAGKVLPLFVPQVKYPRTYHAPWSPNLENDDRMHEGMDFFTGKEVVVTIKKDGENTTMYSDFIHARSVSDMAPHESRTLIKALHGQVAHDIPKDWRVCGENMYAKHSIHYKNLKAYFYVFNIWNEVNVALSWDDTEMYAALLGFSTVPVLYRGIYDEEKIKAIALDGLHNGDEIEGYVIRVADEMPYHAFRYNTAKVVRKNHVRTSKHWLKELVVKNLITQH